MSPPHVRPAAENDVYILEQIYVDAFEASYVNFMPEPYVRQWYDEDAAAKTVRSGLKRCGVAEILGRPVGFVMYDDNTIAELWVDPAYHGKGAGRALVQWVEAQFRTIGFPTITLYCYEANEAALDFYRALRFRKASQFPSQDVPGGPVTVCNMVKMVSKLKR